MCKTCVSYRFCDGVASCEYSGSDIDPNGRPLYDDGLCYEKKEKKKLTPVELSQVRREAGRKGGLAKSGRILKSTIKVNRSDYEVFYRYAITIRKMTVVAAFHEVAKQLVAKYPDLSSENWFKRLV